MVDGTLIINLNPPYVGFVSNRKKSSLQKEACWRNSTEHEIKEMLHELGVLQDEKGWPLEEYIARVPVSLSDDTLEKLGIKWVDNTRFNEPIREHDNNVTNSKN